MTMQKSALWASLLAVAACGGRDFNKPSLLDKPRILAVRADPPQPSFGVTTTLSTLLYEPPREHLATGQCPVPGPITTKWSWCPIGMIADSETNTFTCPFPEESFRQLYAALGLGEAPPYDLGYGKDLKFVNPFPAPLLYALCRGDIGSSLGGAPGDTASAGKSVFTCELPAKEIAVTNKMNAHPIGFQITIKVEVTPTCPDLLPAGFSPLIALYSLHLPTDDSIPVNQNPVLRGIFATDNVVGVLDGGTATPSPGDGALDGGTESSDFDGGAGSGVLDGGLGPVDGGSNAMEVGQGHAGPDGSVPLEEDPVVEVKRDKHVGLALDIDISAAEHLAVPGTLDYDSKTALTQHWEHLYFTWYGEAGSFTGSGKGRNTGYSPVGIPDSQVDDSPSQADLDNFVFNTTNTWDLPKNEDYAYKTARIIVVVRDGRGGVHWTSKQVSLEDAP
jgi:hypothetical protein